MPIISTYDDGKSISPDHSELRRLTKTEARQWLCDHPGRRPDIEREGC